MVQDRLAVLVGLTTLALAGCPAEDDGGDTGASMTTPISDTNDSEDSEDSEEESGNPMTDGTNPTTSTTDPMTTSSESSGEPTTGSECTAEDECIMATDCPNPTDECIGCLCIAGETTGMGACEPGMCSTCTECMPCQMCAQGMGGECEMQLMTCAANPACVAAVQCANMCMDAACQMACVEDNPDGATDFNALIGCLFAPGMGVCITPCS